MPEMRRCFYIVKRSPLKGLSFKKIQGPSLLFGR
jgi:hypothetical protein